MSKTRKKTDLSRKVMGKIKKEKIRMRPRVYFVLESLLWGAGLAIVMISTIFLVNLVCFKLGVHRPLGYLRFGRLGIKPFLFGLPWLIFLLITAGGMIIAVLVRRYDISYKWSFLSLSLSLLALVFTTGFILNSIGLNQRMNQIKKLHPLYQAPSTGKSWLVGEVIQVENKKITLLTPTNKKVLLVWDKNALFPQGESFVVGDKIKTVGYWKKEGVFQAQGIIRGTVQPRLINKGRRKLPRK